MELDLWGRHPIGHQHVYRELVKNELKTMEEKGIIEELKSKWASPIVLIVKKDVSISMCMDYSS